MKNYILRTVDNEGNIANESNLVLNEGSILIQTICAENVSQKRLIETHKWLEDALKNNSNLITITKDVKLSILEKI